MAKDVEREEREKIEEGCVVDFFHYNARDIRFHY